MAPQTGVLSENLPETVTVAEATRMLGLRMESVYRLIYSGHLFAWKVEGGWRVSRASVEEYQSKHSRKSRAGEGNQFEAGTRHERQR